tara:strand:+ start:82 stop:1200 length:1119 start_codon:yes stop_codon:yes gene_type:complete
MLDRLPDGVVLIENGQILRATGRAAEILGISVSKLVGSPMGGCLPHEVNTLVARVEDGASSCTGRDLPWSRPSAPTSLTIKGSRGPLPGQVLLLIAPGSDPRSPSSAEGFRRRLAWLDSLAAGLAHEIRNPLGGIRGAAQLLGRNSSPEDAEELLRLIIRESDRIDHLVERLMDLCRPRPLQRSRISLNQMVHDELKLIQTHNGGSSGVRWELDLDPSLPPLEGDLERICEAISNLLRNASEAAQSLVSVRTRVAPDGRLLQDGLDRGLPLQLDVTDDGPGIEPERVSCLFDPFNTTKTSGTGLGLFVSRLATEDHGGRLDVDPRPGQGARFSLVLFEHLPPNLEAQQDATNGAYQLKWTAPNAGPTLGLRR